MTTIQKVIERIRVGDKVVAKDPSIIGEVHSIKPLWNGLEFLLVTPTGRSQYVPAKYKSTLTIAVDVPVVSSVPAGFII